MKLHTIFKELINKGCNTDIAKRYKVFRQFKINNSKNTYKEFKNIDDGINYFNKVIAYNNFKGFCWDTITNNRGNTYFIILNPIDVV